MNYISSSPMNYNPKRNHDYNNRRTMQTSTQDNDLNFAIFLLDDTGIRISKFSITAVLNDCRISGVVPFTKGSTPAGHQEIEGLSSQNEYTQNYHKSQVTSPTGLMGPRDTWRRRLPYSSEPTGANRDRSLYMAKSWTREIGQSQGEVLFLANQDQGLERPISEWCS